MRLPFARVSPSCPEPIPPAFSPSDGALPKRARARTNCRLAAGRRFSVWATLLVTTIGGAFVTPVAGEGWQADPELVERLMSANRPGVLYSESEIPDYELPDPLLTGHGERIETPEEWERHRPDLLELFREHMYGRRPGAPEELLFNVSERTDNAHDGQAVFERIEIQSRHEGREYSFDLGLFTPAAQAGPFPVILLIDFQPVGEQPAERVKLALNRGYAVGVVHYGQVAPDHVERFTEGVIELLEGEGEVRPADAWMAIAAWGWGASRAMDYFEEDERIDASRVALFGWSRNGKAALWAGAEDERFDIVISHQSGCGGAALNRRRYGETVSIINNAFPHWFCENFGQYNGNEDHLPFDQHQLIALIAPRAVYVGSADEDLWADPRGEYLSLVHASQVYALWGHGTLDEDAMPPLGEAMIAGPLGYHIREGRHSFETWDWERYLDFADQRWSP